MKTFAILFTLFYFLNALAVAPYGIKGQQQSQTLYSNVHQAPNNQVTNLGGIDALIETGNKNLLINPSFEHSTFSTGWTFSGTSNFFEDTSRNIDGKKAGGILAVTTSFALIQDSTLYATQFADGIQGLVSVRVKANNNATGIKVCSRSAGVTSTTNCVDVVANNKWGLYKVPVVLGSISNGISIASTGNTTSAVFVEDAFVGAVDLQATVDASKIAGDSYFAGTTSCTWSRTSTTLGAFTATAACPGPTITNQNLGSWQITDSNLPRQTINNLPAGKYVAIFDAPTYAGTSGSQLALSITDGITTCTGQAAGEDSSFSTANTVSCVFNYTSSGDRNFELVGASSSGTVNIVNNLTSPLRGVKFRLEYFGSSSVYSSTNADTDWASCGHVPADFTGFGTVSAIETQCKRQGSDLLIRGKFTSGISTAVEARLDLPVWNGIQLVSASTPIIPTLQAASGLAGYSVTGTTPTQILIEPSVSYVTFGSQGTSYAGLSKANGNVVLSTGQIYSIPIARIPIEGWQNSNIIIGQFNGLESCTNSYECTDTFSARISGAGNVSNENLDFINGTCSVNGTTGEVSCPFKTGVFTEAFGPNCQVTPVMSQGVNGVMATISSLTNSGVIFKSNRHDALIILDSVILLCQKQGVDYIGKTAKAVASDQNLRTPGITNAKICSFRLSTANALLAQYGGCMTGATTFASGYWTDVPICTVIGGNENASISTRMETLTTTTITAQSWNSSANAVATTKYFICHGYGN